VIIDLAGRVVAAESTYSQPGHEGTIYYHDGTQRTDVPILYRVSDEWRFLNSVAEYEGFRAAQLQQSRLILDPREILYGRPLLMHILTEIRHSEICAEGHKILKQLEQAENADGASDLVQNEEAIKPLMADVSAIHARWLMTPLAELDGQSPREVLLAKRELVDFDLHTREMQWTFLGEGPPCLPRESFAYRFGGFGSHECIIYYDLVRVLLWRTVEQGIVGNMNRPFDFEAGVKQLEKMKSDWLENPQPGLDNRLVCAHGDPVVQADEGGRSTAIGQIGGLLGQIAVYYSIHADVCRKLPVQKGILRAYLILIDSGRRQ